MLLLNILTSYCRMGTSNALGDDSIAALLQCLRHDYEEPGHYQNWIADDETERAKNLLKGNLDIDALQRAHTVQIYQYGSTAL